MKRKITSVFVNFVHEDSDWKTSAIISIFVRKTDSKELSCKDWVEDAGTTAGDFLGKVGSISDKVVE